MPKPAPNLSWGEVAAGGDGDGDRLRSFSSAVAPPLGEVDPGKGTLGVAGGMPDGACELEVWFVPKPAPNYLGGGSVGRRGWRRG